jgi:hypothetical protein
MMRYLVRPLAGGRIRPPRPMPAGVEIRQGRFLARLGGWFTGSGLPAAAVTLGDTIIVHPDAPLTERLLRHELEHVRQWRAAPLTFPVRYAWQHLRCGYRDNPFEIAARAAERAPGDVESS